jgi:hypothetical protein
LISEIGNALCPETGYLEFKGAIGTNLWVVPNKDWTADFDLWQAEYQNVYI